MLDRMSRARLTVAALLLATNAPFATLWAAPGADTKAAVTRVLTLLRAVGDEYREALDESGKIVRPIEIEEARLFLAEARSHGRRLGAEAPADLDGRIEKLSEAIAATAPLDAVQAQVDETCAALSAATGVGEEFLPPAPPSVERGATVYKTNCVSCHGELGAGDGPDAARLDPKPADFSAPSFMRGETPSDFFHVISAGRRRAAMPAWDAVLNVQERWDAIAYLWTFSLPATRVAEGQGVFVAHCAGCHGPAGDGRGSYAGALPKGVPDLSTPGSLAGHTLDALFAAVSDGVAGTAMPGFARVLDEEQRWKAVEFLRALSLGGHARGPVPQAAAGAAAGGRAADVEAAFAEVRRLLAESADAYRRGDAAATDLATDAYMTFEPLEARIAAREPALVRAVEEGFLGLRSALAKPGADVGPLFDATRSALAAAADALASPADAWARFAQSAMIILREGFEVVLLLGALLAWVMKSGNLHMRRPIWGGALVGVVASLATAALLVTVFRMTPGLADTLEGAAMLVASVVLFWVSYWIISKAEADRWQQYIKGKVQKAVVAGSGTALFATAFLAVYREGFETVLFYQALFASAPAGDTMIPAGFAAGAAGLAIVYVVFARFGRRIPISQFFLVSGGLLYAMSVAFAGRGVHELQEAGVIDMTPVAWAPSIEALGIFPSVESLLAQGVLLLLLLYAIVLTLRRRRAHEREGQAAVGTEVGRLRGLAEALREEVAATRGDGAGAVGARLDGLLDEVRALEKRVAPGNGRV
jgi:FTR1 family protein